eukprot:COSAG05_NODE_28_length_29121_cov_56.951933_35_plen_84_part_00
MVATHAERVQAVPAHVDTGGGALWVGRIERVAILVRAPLAVGLDVPLEHQIRAVGNVTLELCHAGAALIGARILPALVRLRAA